MNKFSHYIFTFFLIVSVSMFGQTKAKKYEGVYLDKHNRQLKGPVHKVYFRYSHAKDSLDKFYRETFMEDFDFLPRITYYEFSKEGLALITKRGDFRLPFDTLDTANGEIIKCEPDIKDYYQKKKYKSQLNPALRTCNQELFLKVNTNWSMYGQDEKNDPEKTNEFYRNIYMYKFDALGRISKTKEYSVLPSCQEKGKPYKLNEKDLFITVYHKYDAKGRIIFQRVAPGPQGKGNDLVGMGAEEGLPFEFMGSHAYLSTEDAKIYYKYDNKDRLIQIKFYGDGIGLLLSQNDYTYHPTEGYLLTNTLMEEGTGASFRNMTKRFRFTYNEQGDIIRRENFADDPPRRWTTRKDMYDKYMGGANFQNRYYKYEYDKYNNWIKCYLYMEGTLSGAPSLIAERKIEYYN